MKRSIAALALVFCLLGAGFLSGCKGQEGGGEGSGESPEAQSAAEIQVQALADQLLAEVSFEDQLSQVDQNTALMLYGLEESQVADFAVYAGSGATAEEIAVFEAVDGDAAKAVQEGMQARLSSQISDYGDYRPQEVPKLESAVVKTSGNYVVLCVSADNDAAADLIEEAF